MKRLGSAGQLAPLLLVLAAATALAGEPKVTDLAHRSVTATVGPGHHLALRAAATGDTIELVQQTKNSLDPACSKALARAPTWLQQPLREAFRRMSAADQLLFAQGVVQATARTVDEVAFLVAHLSAEDLARATPRLISRNAELIYEVDPELAYVDLVEHGDAQKGGDFYTTAKYHTLKDGKPVTFEVPREIYYWWVVHPMLDMEYVTTIDPAKGSQTAPPAGIGWREFLLAKKGAKLSPGQHYIMRAPSRITDADLAGYSFGKAAAYGSLAPSLVGPNEVIRGPKGEPVLVHYSLSGGTCNANQPNPDGIYLVTTMPLEQAAANGKAALLENLLDAGPGRASMRSVDTVVHAVCNEGRTKQARGYLIVRDRLPFGLSADPNEAALTKLGRSYKVLDSAAFAKLVDDGKLYYSAKPYVSQQYNKIVVPSDQPRALYAALSKRRAQLEKFVKYGGVFELHGATREADDWSDLTMPGGFKTQKQSAQNYITSVKVYGNALLRDVMQGVKYLWTGVRRCHREAKAACLKGDRTLAQSPDAIDRIGWWSGQMIDRSVGERACLRNLGQSSSCKSQTERSWYPQRIVPNHFGNCGEIQDVVGAASRAVLVPSLLTMSLEDHVWNEFYAGAGQWLPYDTGWSDTAMRVGDWSVSGDGSAGGGKENAVMIAWRGDGQIVNLLGRYKAVTKDNKIDYEYTANLELTISVTDAAGRPVDGARVTLMTEWFYSATRAVKGIFGVTGRDGVVKLRVGDKRNFYINIASALGHYPSKLDSSKYFVDRAQFELLVKKSEAVGGAKISKTFKLAGKDANGAPYKTVAAPAATARAWSAPNRATTHRRLKLQLSVPAEHRPVDNPLNRRTFVETVAQGLVDLYVTDAANYDKFKAGKPFEAAVVKQGVSAASALQVELPDRDTRWVVVLSNRRMTRFAQQVQATLTLQQVSAAAAPPDPADAADEGGCSLAAPTPDRSRGASLWLLLGLWLLWRRRATSQTRSASRNGGQ